MIGGGEHASKQVLIAHLDGTHLDRPDRRTRLRVRLALAAVALLVSVGCSPDVAPKPRLVVLYATCTLSRAYLAPYAPEVRYTPHLARFAERSLVFDRHHTESGQSGIAFASLFTGTQAPTHGVYAHPKPLPESLELITEAFAAGGYDVFSWVKHPMASVKLGYAQGVPAGNMIRRDLLASTDKHFQSILDSLERDPEYKAFIVLNFTVTHGPYGMQALALGLGRQAAFCEEFPTECAPLRDHPETFALDRARHYYASDRVSFDFDELVKELDLSDERVSSLVETINMLYKPGVFHLDGLFGELVDAIEGRGLLGESVIAFTSDHGEILYRDNAFFQWSHGYQQAPEVIIVPFVLHAPGVDPGRYDGVTRSIDVFPTLAGLAGVPIPDTLGMGVDLSSELRSGKVRRDLLAFSHSTVLPYVIEKGGGLTALKNFGAFFPRRDPNLMWVSVRSGNQFYKLRRFGEDGFVPAVYDLGSDPGERIDRFDPDDAEQAAMFERLEAYRQRLVAGYVAFEGRSERLPENREAELLKVLGYIE